ncbi:methyl-accepting chemotaxis protein [Myxococcus faecalis]|uniref:methyl-accepting chemotaxis protein n=2 Tax=Myxococcus faecalis TaxID=3115646 RepID=UPI0024C5CB02|nr:methyl-accepting chemotaxis protein [Myxococcus sp. MH1]
MSQSTRWLVVLCWMLVLAWSSAAQAQTRAASVMELKDGWLHHWGDSPLGPDGVPTWAKEPDKVDWKSMEALKVPPGREAHTMLWVSIPVPRGGWGEPALMLGSVTNAYEVYVDGQRVYANGKLNPSGTEVRESIWAQLIPLPASAQGSRVLLRIQSSTAAMGVSQHARVGPRHELLARVVRTGLGCLVTGNLLLVIAQVALGMSLLGRQRRMLLALGVFSGGAGVLLVGMSGVVSAVWGVELSLWRATFLAAYCVLPGLGWFIQEGILEGRARWFSAVVWTVTVLAALQAVVAMVDLGTASRLFQVLMLYSIPVLLTYVIVAVVAALRGNVDARIFSAGLGVLTLVLVAAMLPLLGWVKMEGMFIHWGFLAFTASLVGIVARRSSHVVRSLSSHASQLEARRKDVRELAEGMGTGAGELATVAQQLRTSSEEQTDGIGRQATALKELEQTVQEIRQGSLVTADKARVLAESIVAAEEAGRDGGAALDKTLTNLEAIREEVSEMARRILALDERTREIAGIVDTVKGLADQSNMLAVNAAIEAARSGEHGRGFSVVSREVRSLADQSILATQRIREVLEGVSSSMREAAKMSEQGEQRVRVSVEAVRVSGTQLRKLAGIIGDTSNSVRQISAAVSQQDAGTSQIAVAIQDMSGQMQQTLRVVEETRNVTRSVQTLAQSMAGSARKALESGTLGS